MTDDFDKSLAHIRAIGENIHKMLEPEELVDYIFTELEDYAWQSGEPSFTKRIYTPIPTKRRLRVTLRNNIYIELLLKVTN